MERSPRELGTCLMPPACFRFLASLVVTTGLCLSAPAHSAGQEATSLKVRIEADKGPHYVGEGIELAVAVAGRDQRPTLELPKLNRAEIWSAGTSFHPLSTGGIGNVVSGKNLYITRLRLVPRQTGPLLVPPVTARLDNQSGKSGSLKLDIVPVPLLGRPAEFLGGVGPFTLEAAATPATVRLGQELIYRITIKGPAAWGSVDQPALKRFERGPLAPRIDVLPEEADREPPRRTWVFRIRPTRAGSEVIPPLAVAAFDPELERYITKVTPGLPIKVVAVPAAALDQLHYTAPDAPDPSSTVATIVYVLYIAVLMSLSALAVVLRKNHSRGTLTGPKLARRFARVFARKLARRSPAHRHNEEAGTAARIIVGGLVSYARIAAGRPPGAITPREAGELVQRATGSDQLAHEAQSLMEHCDQALFAERGNGDETLLMRRARELFSALGRVPGNVKKEDPSR